MLGDDASPMEELRAARMEVAHLRTALETRLVIGQAQGIIMERFGIAEEEAFRFLTRLASSEERKLRAVAADIVGTRHMPARPCDEEEA